MNIIITAVDDRYLECAKTFLYSMKANSGLSEKILILHFNDEFILSASSRKILEKINNNIEFKEIEYRNLYEKYCKSNPKFLSLECFNIPGYDKILFVDCDMLCVKSLAGIWNYDFDIAMVRELHRPQFNAGFILINKRIITQENYNNLLQHEKKPETFGHDQAIFNEYFRNIKFLPKEYNIFNIHFENQARMIHYIVKPYANDYARMPAQVRDLWYLYSEKANQCLV